MKKNITQKSLIDTGYNVCLFNKGIYKNDKVVLASGFKDRLATYKMESENCIRYCIFSEGNQQSITKRLAKYYRSWNKDTIFLIIPNKGEALASCYEPMKNELINQ